MTARSECECDANRLPPEDADELIESLRRVPAITIYAMPGGGWQVTLVFNEVPAVAGPPLRLHEALLCVAYALDSMVTAREAELAP